MFAFYCWKPVTNTKANSKKNLATSKLFLDADFIRAWSTRLWLLVRLSFYLSMRSLNWQSLCPSVCPFIFFVCRFSIQSLQHVSVSIYYVGLINQLPVCLSVFRSVCPPIRLSVCPSKCPSYCLSTRPFFHFSITNWSLTQFNVFIQRKRNT